MEVEVDAGTLLPTWAWEVTWSEKDGYAVLFPQTQEIPPDEAVERKTLSGLRSIKHRQVGANDFALCCVDKQLAIDGAVRIGDRLLNYDVKAPYGLSYIAAEGGSVCDQLGVSDYLRHPRLSRPVRIAHQDCSRPGTRLLLVHRARAFERTGHKCQDDKGRDPSLH